MTTRDFIASCAQGAQKYPRNGWRMVSSVGWDGKHIYSYGKHYPLLINIPMPGGAVWILNDRGYSVTTSKHIGIAGMFAASRVHLPAGSSMFGVNITLKAIREAAQLEIAHNREGIEETKKRIALKPRYAIAYGKTIARYLERIETLKQTIRIMDRSEKFSNTIKTNE